MPHHCGRRLGRDCWVSVRSYNASSACRPYSLARAHTRPSWHKPASPPAPNSFRQARMHWGSWSPLHPREARHTQWGAGCGWGRRPAAAAPRCATCAAAAGTRAATAAPAAARCSRARGTPPQSAQMAMGSSHRWGALTLQLGAVTDGEG
jgi:hypothetical protein